MGDVTITITNTLNEAVDNESIGYGEMRFLYTYDPNTNWNPI